jgi:hypothetical protein
MYENSKKNDLAINRIISKTVNEMKKIITGQDFAKIVKVLQKIF